MSTYSEDVKSVFHYGKNHVAKFINFILIWFVTPLLLVLTYMGDSSAFNLLVFVVVVQYVIVSFLVIGLLISIYAVPHKTFDDGVMIDLQKNRKKYDEQKSRGVKRFSHQALAVIFSCALAYMGYIVFAFTYLFFMVFMTHIVYKLLDSLVEELKKVVDDEAKN